MGQCCSTPPAEQTGPKELVGPPPPSIKTQEHAKGAVVPPLRLQELVGADAFVDVQDASEFFTARTSATNVGWESGEEDWQDAASELSLADALERFEEEQDLHIDFVDEAIQELKARHHLVPEAIEMAATECYTSRSEADRRRRYEELAPSTTAGAAAQRPPRAPAAPLSRRLSAALEDPGVQALAAELRAARAAGRIFDATRLAEQLAAELGPLPGGGLPAAAAAALGIDLAALEADLVNVKSALQQLDDDEGWMVSRDDSLRVLYKHVPGTTIHSLKFTAMFDHPIEHLLALCHEFDLVKTWNKFSLDSMKVAEPSIYEMWVYGAQWMPPPFKDMHGLIHCRGFDLGDSHRALLVLLNTERPEDLPPDASELPEGASLSKRRWFDIDGYTSCIKMRPLPPASAAELEAARLRKSRSRFGFGRARSQRGTPGSPDSPGEPASPLGSVSSAAAGGGGPQRTRAQLMMHLDPHLAMIPAFLVNFVLGVLAPYMYREIQRVLDTSFADPGSEYNRRIAAQPELFGTLRARLAEFAAELGLERPTASTEVLERVAEGGEGGGGAAGEERAAAACAAPVQQYQEPGTPTMPMYYSS